MNTDFSRYNRQMMLPQIGEEGQLKISQARVLVVGVGGLGSPLTMYLTGAGVGCLGIMDDDVVSVTNLHRQVMYTQDQVGHPKVYCAQARLKAMNPEVEVIAYHQRLTAENAEEIIRNYDMVLDGCDNYDTRYVIDAVCAKLHKPYVFGAICGTSCQASVFNYRKNFRYVDLFPDDDGADRNLLSKAVVGMTAALTASVQAMEALKIICGMEDILDGILWTYDLMKHEANRYHFA